MSDWSRRWDALKKVYEKRSLLLHNWRLPEDWGYKPNPPAIIAIEPPAEEEEIIKIEKQIGCSIPSSFRKVLREYSRKLDICWMFPDDENEYETIYDRKFRNFSWGILHWSLEELPALQKELKGWNDTMYNNPDDPYDKHWLNKFAVCEVGHSDYIVIEAESEASQQVLYLSHDGDTDMNGFRLGKDFEDYIDRLSLLGCPSEGFTLTTFLSPPEPYLQPNGENAKQWREWFGLDVE